MTPVGSTVAIASAAMNALRRPTRTTSPQTLGYAAPFQRMTTSATRPTSAPVPSRTGRPRRPATEMRWSCTTRRTTRRWGRRCSEARRRARRARRTMAGSSKDGGRSGQPRRVRRRSGQRVAGTGGGRSMRPGTSRFSTLHRHHLLALVVTAGYPCGSSVPRLLNASAARRSPTPTTPRVWRSERTTRR